MSKKLSSCSTESEQILGSSTKEWDRHICVANKMVKQYHKRLKASESPHEHELHSTEQHELLFLTPGHVQP